MEHKGNPSDTHVGGKREEKKGQTHTFHTIKTVYGSATERRHWIRKYSDNQIDFTRICACTRSVCTDFFFLNLQFYISVQMAVATQFWLTGSKMYTVRKHVCINCDGGNRSFTLLHMRRASWILLTVLKWILHFLSPVTFREAVTLKFPAFWQFQTNLHRPSCAAEAESWLGCPHCVSRLSQDCICLRLTGLPLWNPTPHQLVWKEALWRERGKSKGGREEEIARNWNRDLF